PSTWSVASTTYQSLFRSAAFAVHVFLLLISNVLVNHFHQRQPARGGGAYREPAVPRSKDFSHPLGCPPAQADLGQSTGDAPREPAQEALRDQLHLDEISTPVHRDGAHFAPSRFGWLGG